MQFHESPARTPTYLIAGGLVVDGSGNGPRKADVRIVGNTIVEIGPDLPAGDSEVLHVAGQLVTPGFMDLHAHSEGSLWKDPQHLPKVAQGVTFELLGQDGLGFAPVTVGSCLEELAERLIAWHGRWDIDDLTWRDLSSFFIALEGRGLGINVASLVPHGTLRLTVGVPTSRPPNPLELKGMQDLIAAGLSQGAFGLSTGLIYEPARHADFQELVELCRVLGPGRVFVPHLRDYQKHPFESYREAIDVADHAGSSLHLTHALLNGEQNSDRAGELLELISQAGDRTTADVYPYDAGSTYMHVFLPAEIATAPMAQLLASLRHVGVQERIGDATSHLDWNRVVVAGVDNPKLRPALGKSIQALAVEKHQHPVETYCQLLIDDRLSTTCIHFNGNWDNVSTLIKADGVAIASDSILVGELPHPRGWGTFARYIERFVASGDIEVGPAIYKVTGLPASILGVARRGVLRPGNHADLCCFDPGSVRERATYEVPRQLATGFTHVIVNGIPVIRDSQPTGELPGRVVRA